MSLEGGLCVISYALLESSIRPDIQPKLSRSHEAEPSGIWMTEGEFITCSFMLRKNNKYIS